MSNLEELQKENEELKKEIKYLNFKLETYIENIDRECQETHRDRMELGHLRDKIEHLTDKLEECRGLKGVDDGEYVAKLQEETKKYELRAWEASQEQAKLKYENTCLRKEVETLKRGRE